MNDSSILFDVLTPLGFRVRCHESYWNGKIINSHPIMAGRIADVKRTLSDPAEVRLSRTDVEVYLFYAPDEKRLVCVVIRSSGSDGFLITAYPADKMKEGQTIWKK